MGDEMKGLNEQVDGYGGIQTEGFVGNDADIGQMFGEIVGNQRDIGVHPHKDGYFRGSDAFVAEFTHDVGHPCKGLFLIIISRQELYVDQSVVVQLVRHTLFHIGIGSLKGCGFRIIL